MAREKFTDTEVMALNAYESWRRAWWSLEMATGSYLIGRDLDWKKVLNCQREYYAAAKAYEYAVNLMLSA